MEVATSHQPKERRPHSPLEPSTEEVEDEVEVDGIAGRRRRAGRRASVAVDGETAGEAAAEAKPPATSAPAAEQKAGESAQLREGTKAERLRCDSGEQRHPTVECEGSCSCSWGDGGGGSG